MEKGFGVSQSVKASNMCENIDSKSNKHNYIYIKREYEYCTFFVSFLRCSRGKGPSRAKSGLSGTVTTGKGPGGQLTEMLSYASSSSPSSGWKVSFSRASASFSGRNCRASACSSSAAGQGFERSCGGCVSSLPALCVSACWRVVGSFAGVASDHRHGRRLSQ